MKKLNPAQLLEAIDICGETPLPDDGDKHVSQG